MSNKIWYCLLLVLLVIIINKNFFKYNLYYYIEESIFRKKAYNNYIDAFNKAKDFINDNINGILINKQEIKLFKKPKISVIIPCYNCRENVLSTIRSIQNQNFSSFELIVVNDFSIDNTSLFLEQLQNEDKRIKIINNNKNMGTLYSRSIGALSSKGKYIYPIDSDDMFLDKDIFSIITNFAEKENLDITIFNSIITDLKPNIYSTKINKDPFEESHKINKVLIQPELGYYIITPSHNIEKVNFNEVLIHAKCIKTKIYQKALFKLGKERYSRIMKLGEDDLANIIIFNTAKKAKFIPKFGYIYIERENSVSKLQKNDTIFISRHLYILDALIDFTQDLPKNKKILVNFILYLFKDNYLKEALNKNKYNYNLFISCLERILNCKYISDYHKNKIRKRGKSLSFINFNIVY
jgi:glycosyltransferase involved in cell wall biosynthesis